MSFFEELKRRNVFRVGIAYGVSAWVLLQFADLVLDNIVAPAWVMHVLMLLVALGFVVSLVIAWAYEMTPEGIKRESEVDRDQSITNHTARKLHYVTLGAIVVLIALLLADRFMVAGNEEGELAQAVETAEPAIEATQSDSTDMTLLSRGVAVLPFANLSEDPNNAFFAGGVHEDILTNLSRIPDLRVISRTSMLKIAEQGLGIREIGLQLDVSHVLEGSVRRAGNQVRVTVQLIDASNDDHIWADNFDRNLDDIFAIQSEVARKIAGQLETELSPELAQRLAEVPTQNTRAYDLYLKARELRREWLAAEGFRKMRPLLEEVVALDPNFLDAQVMLAMVYGRLVWTGADPDGVYREKARTTTELILRQWPGRAETDFAQGNFYYTVKRDYQKALFAYQKALPFMPNSTDLLIAIASSYKRLGQFELGLPVISLAESLDPQHPTIVAEKTYHLIGVHPDETALAHAREAVKRFPDDLINQVILARLSLSLTGDRDEYVRIMKPIKQKSPLMFLAEPIAMRMSTSAAEIDEQIAWLYQIKSQSDAWTAIELDIRAAELLNLANREEESQALARTTLDTVGDRLAQNLPLGGNTPELDYAEFAYLACLAGDEEAFKRYKAKSESIEFVPIYTTQLRSLTLAVATAECGDAEVLWALVKDWSADLFEGTSKWQLIFDPLYQHYFADIPAYQEMVRELQGSE